MAKGKKSRFDRRRITEITPERLELRKSGQVLTLTRKQALARQIDTAIDMWVNRREPLAIHLIIMAAHQVLCDLGFNSPIKRDVGWTYWGLAYDWLKHANSDPAHVLDFPLRVNQIIMYECVTAMDDRFGGSTVLMDTYAVYAALNLLPEYPEIRKGAIANLPEGLALSEIEGLSPNDFFAKVAPVLASIKVRLPL